MSFLISSLADRRVLFVFGPIAKFGEKGNLDVVTGG